MKLIEIEGKLLNPALITFVEKHKYLNKDIVTIHFSGGGKTDLTQTPYAVLFDKLKHIP